MMGSDRFRQGLVVAAITLCCAVAGLYGYELYAHLTDPYRAARGIERPVAVTPGGVTLRPLSMPPAADTLLCSRADGQQLWYRTDRHGFGNDDSHWGRPVDVAVVGDSFVEGICLDQEDRLVPRLRAAGLAALNLGVRGSGPLVELARIREYAAKLRPRVVVWSYYEGNDVMWLTSNGFPSDLEREAAEPALTSYVEGKGDQGLLSPAGFPEARWETVQSELSFDYGLGGFLRLERTIAMAASAIAREGRHCMGQHCPAVYRRRMMPVFAAALARARAEVDAAGGRLVFLYLPEGRSVRGRLHPLRDDVLATARALGLPVVDLLPAFQAQGNGAGLFDGPNFSGHYSPAGMALVTEALLPQLR